MTAQNFTEDEIVVYNDFIDKWTQVANTVGIEEIEDIFSDRYSAYATVRGEVQEVVADSDSVHKIAVAIIDNILGVIRTASLTVGQIKLARKNKEVVSSLSLKHSWDNGGQKSEDYHPGSNTGPIPHKTPRSPSDLSRADQHDSSDYSTPSIIERDFAEEHAGAENRGSGPGAAPSGGGGQSHSGQPGKIDNIYPEPSNWLRPFKNMPVPPNRYNQDFNTGFDTEYTQRQYGDLSLKREKKATTFDKGSLQTSDIPKAVIQFIKDAQKDIDTDKLDGKQDDKGWVENGIQKNFHITILYGINDDTISQINDVFDTHKPIKIEVDKIEYFDNGDIEGEGTVAVLKCKSSELSKFHKTLKDSLGNSHREGAYKAHITIAYLKSGERLDNIQNIPKISWEINEIEMSESSGKLKKISNDMNPEEESVCAWCKSAYDSTTGLPTRVLSPEEYDTIESHGICGTCAEEQRTKWQQLKAKKNAAIYMPPDDPNDKFNQLWWRGIRKTLENPTTTEDVLWQLAVEHNQSPDVLASAIIHPNMQDSGKIQRIQQWLNTIDEQTITDFENTIKEEEGIPINDDFPRNPINEAAPRREPFSQFQMTSQEASMLANHSSDEIWEMARTGEPLAQQLITKGLIAARKQQRKFALNTWAEVVRDLGQPRPLRQLLSIAMCADSIENAGRALFGNRRVKKIIKAQLIPIKSTTSKKPRVNFANILDAPRGVLDPGMWQDGPNNLPMLIPSVKRELVEQFFSYINRFAGYVSPEAWIKNMFYCGSTATYNYNDKSDIDIHIIVDWHDLIEFNPDKKHENLDDIWQELHDSFWYTLNNVPLPGTKHPLQYYVIKPGEEKKLVAQKEELYDIGHDLWLVPPSKLEEDPAKVIELAASDASEVMGRIDQHLSDVRKGLVDYALLTELVNVSNAKGIYLQLTRKVSEIDEHLQDLKKEYRELKMKRQDAFTGYEVNNNFSLNNVIFKIVEKYRYMDVLRKIKRITDGMELSPNQVPDIADTLGLSDLFE